MRVLLVDDDPLVLVALRGLLRTDPSLEVVATVDDGARVLAAVRRFHPDIVLLDARMRGVSGPEVIAPLRRAAPRVGIIVMSSFIGPESESAVVTAGADAFLPKVAPPERFSSEIRRVAGLEAAPRGVALSAREREVARALAEGLTNAAIARALGLTDSTTRTYVSRLLEKTGATSRVELANLVNAGRLDVSELTRERGTPTA
ncbi:DNA-binding response regulator, NarL/FixJ family, contains REC and HTH domains [Rathayibacter oskolensis]|uniref:DNA-binding response regulator, NarL/FixJ family, contains REC and HTH domains n=1 Tax=Rathayibacter oskolensis TaxID=1891671 RepID=A0A1X7MX08_9MICO|nr:DNA-binding response regulator, NarL/FixJ family, contains REC and HTH domains [Rathayibacter oskolensis]